MWDMKGQEISIPCVTSQKSKKLPCKNHPKEAFSIESSILFSQIIPFVTFTQKYSKTLNKEFA